MRDLAIGYFSNEDFQEACGAYVSQIREVFFSWPGILSCRPTPEDTADYRARMVKDLAWCRSNGILLDVLFNCNCYGEAAVSQELVDQVERVLAEMAENGVFPDILTTTSPFIASQMRQRHPEVELRSSVNMRVHGTIGFEYITGLFDSFYLSREHQREIGYLACAQEWAKKHGRLIGVQVNSGCLRQCPYQQFHDNLHGHHRIRQTAVGKTLGFNTFLCRQYMTDAVARGGTEAVETVLRGTWIRPEDLKYVRPYVSFIKVSTRNVKNPSVIVRAYAEERYDGNLLEILDPNVSELLAPVRISNRQFGEDWFGSGIASLCANNCVHCGKCEALAKKVMES